MKYRNKHEGLSGNRASSLPVRYLLGAQRSTWKDPWSPGTFMQHVMIEQTERLKLFNSQAGKVILSTIRKMKGKR